MFNSMASADASVALFYHIVRWRKSIASKIFPVYLTQHSKMKFTYAIVLFGSSSLALDQNNVSNIDDIIRTDLPTGSIARCPQVQWRPLSPYKSILLPEPWWFLPDADEANKDHYDVTHPTLPPNIILPDPLLPTENKTIDGLYTNAIKIYKADNIKQV